MTNNTNIELSAVEAERYDRQIRLWGIESQEKLRAANALLIGIRGLGSEIAKNILLCGINSLTILDNGVVTKEEQTQNFLLTPDTIGSKIAEAVLVKAQCLNPLVKIVADTSDVDTKDDKFFEKFTVIIATGVKTGTLFKIDQICRARNIKLISGDVHGMFGYSVSDFQTHKFYEDQIQLPTKKRDASGNLKATEKVTKKVVYELNYPSLKNVLVLPDSKQKAPNMRNARRCNEYFFLLLVLAEFKNRSGRNPLVASKTNDIETMKKIKKDVFELYKAEPSKLSDDVFNLVFGQVAPVCAILGGVIAQEVIKAVSHKEVPINNVFLFNPYTYAGKEEAIGI